MASDLKQTRPTFRLAYVPLVLIAMMVQPIYEQYRRHMRVRKPPASFEDWRTKTEFVKGEMGVTYYERGHLDKVMNGWRVQKGEPGFHVYRLKDKMDFKMDMSQFDSKDIRVFHVKDKKNCTAIGGTVLRTDHSCIDRYTVRLSNGKDILEGKETNAYGSFTEFSSKTMEYLTSEVVNIHPIEIAPEAVEQGFISNLQQSTVTAQLHCNPMTMSMAVQYVGTKTWLFFGDQESNARDGWEIVPAPLAAYPSHAPKAKKMKYFLYTSQPGDVMFFPPSWSHAVVTHKGPNVMINFRQFFMKQFFFQPFFSLHSFFNNKYLKAEDEQLADSSLQKDQSNHGEKSVTNEFTRIFHKPFRENHPDNVENVMTNILLDHVCSFEDHFECKNRKKNLNVV